MTNPELSLAVPSGADFRTAFANPSKKHSSLITMADIHRAPDGKLHEAAVDFFGAGIDFLARYSQDGYIEELGRTTSILVNQGLVGLFFARNNIDGVTHFNNHKFYDPSKYLKIINTEDTTVVYKELKKLTQHSGIEGLSDSIPVFVVSGLNGKDSVPYAKYKAGIIIPPKFIINCLTDPVSGLSSVVCPASLLRDLANGRTEIDQMNVTIRQEASISHLLISLSEANDDLEVARELYNMTERFPLGINSLPEGVRYTGNFTRIKPIPGQKTG